MESTDQTQWHRLTEVDPDKLTATCSVCGPTKIHYKGKTTSGRGRRVACVTARRANNVRNYYRTTFGITVEDKQKIVDSQNGVCAICPEPVDVVTGHLDHNHETMALRGVLCGNCNQALGKFKDDPALLRRAIEYLKLHSGQERSQ